MKRNNKSWIRQLSESYVRYALNEQSDTHQKIKDFFVNTLARQYPHKYNEKTRRHDSAVSAEHISSILDATGPHTSAQSAIAAIRPHAIDGNYSLEDRLRDRYPEIKGDFSEHPDYDSMVMDTEQDYAEELEDDLNHHLSSGGGSEDNRIPRSM